MTSWAAIVWFAIPSLGDEFLYPLFVLLLYLVFVLILNVINGGHEQHPIQAFRASRL
jgi:hypothetical protein